VNRRHQVLAQPRRRRSDLLECMRDSPLRVRTRSAPASSNVGEKPEPDQ